MTRGSRRDGTVEGLHRRRAAAMRLVPLSDGHRDPDRRPCPEDVTDGALLAWAAARRHLAAIGLPGIVPDEVRAAAERRRVELARLAGERQRQAGAA